MRYLTLSELIYINGTVLHKPEIVSGSRHIRDIQLLQAAVARPESSAFGQDAYPTLSEKVAALMHSVSRNHPFTDGNKRTATIGGIFMFRVNGQHIIWQQEKALTIIIGLADGTRHMDEIAAWFPLTPVEPVLEADAETDMRLIADIIEEQKWLLHELERR